MLRCYLPCSPSLQCNNKPNWRVSLCQSAMSGQDDSPVTTRHMQSHRPGARSIQDAQATIWADGHLQCSSGCLGLSWNGAPWPRAGCGGRPQTRLVKDSQVLWGLHGSLMRLSNEHLFWFMPETFSGKMSSAWRHFLARLLICVSYYHLWKEVIHPFTVYMKSDALIQAWHCLLRPLFPDAEDQFMKWWHLLGHEIISGFLSCCTPFFIQQTLGFSSFQRPVK